MRKPEPRAVKEVFRCQVCRALALFGFNVSLRSRGNWYCGDCCPEVRS